MRVWRVEHKDSGFGPYLHLPSPVDCYGSDRHPLPYSDGIKKFPEGHYKYGFESVQKLKAWFNKTELRKLEKAGFVCRIYKVQVKHVTRGKKQLVFSYDRAKVLRKSRVLKSA